MFYGCTTSGHNVFSVQSPYYVSTSAHPLEIRSNNIVCPVSKISARPFKNICKVFCGVMIDISTRLVSVVVFPSLRRQRRHEERPQVHLQSVSSSPPVRLYTFGKHSRQEEIVTAPSCCLITYMYVFTNLTCCVRGCLLPQTLPCTCV